VNKARIVLAPGREKSLRRRHPWVFSGAIARVESEPAAGATVEIHAHGGEWLGRAAWSPQSQIAARVWSFDPEEAIDGAFFRRRLQRALATRQRDPAWNDGNAGRLVNAESDGLPGVIVDRYADWLVCQFASAGAEHWRDTLVAELAALLPCRGIFERSDLEVRAKEGLEERSGLLHGEEPPELVEIHQHDGRIHDGRIHDGRIHDGRIHDGRIHDGRFLVDLRHGHKTGFYLDQRDNRRLLAGYCTDAEMLNAFCYSGAFAVTALRAGARHATNIDSAAPALELAGRNLALNGCGADRYSLVEANVFQELRRLRAEDRRFDLIVLDPPRFVDSRARLNRASRGYKDINLLACQLLRPGGVLVTFSCSGLLEPALFQKIVADAALDAGRDAQILHRLAQSADHPVLLSFPEGAYLKGLICRVW
jgi:23S rRNA (cytosine1962-C5)-methyltransferase